MTQSTIPQAAGGGVPGGAVGLSGGVDGVEAVSRRWIGRVTRVLFLRQFLIWTTAYLFVWGTVVLVSRVVGNFPRLPLLYGVGGVVILAAGAWAWALRRRPGGAAVRAMLDSHSHAGGLYMVDAAAAGWQGRVPRAKLPGVSWRGRRQVAMLAVGAVFVGAAFAAPAWITQVGQRQGMDISQQVATLNAQLEVLAQENVIHEEQATELSEKLKQVALQADGRDPVKTWESLDHIQSQMEQSATAAAAEAATQSRELQKMQMLAQALADHGGALSKEQFAQAMQSLQDMVNKAAAENAAFREMMKQQGLEPGGQELTPEQLQALNQAMSMTREELQELLQKLQQSGLCENPGSGKQGQQGQQGQMAGQQGQAGGGGQQLSPEQVAQMLSQMMQGRSVEEILEAIEQLQQMQGQGGVGRGGGPTDMTWKDQPTEKGDAAFKDQVLPPAELQALQDSQRVGLGAGAPKVDEEATGSAGGVLGGQAAQGSAARQVVLPRHRGAVRKYFDRQDQSQPAPGQQGQQGQ